MSKFTDAAGNEWTVEFDCFVLDQVRKEAEVDLADVSAGGLLAVERDVTALGRVLVSVCSEQITQRGKSPRDFLKGVRGDALTRAREAVLEALADFFPQSEWSAMQSSLRTRKSQPDLTPEQLVLASTFMKMDPEVQRDVMKMVQQEMAFGNSPSLESEPSVQPQDATLQSPADDSPVSAASVPEV